MSELTIPILATTDELAAFCKTATQSRYISIDTEFIRERTYYPKLCLVQVACEQQAVIIDPLAEGIDLTPLFDLLQNEKVLKVFHAARQDVEIFYYLTGKIPHPMFDTQVAAMVCGFGESISYDGLVREIAKKQLDKTSRFTNWEQRPLTRKQLEYALADVVHLRTVFEVLEQRIEKTGRDAWIGEEMEVLTEVSTYAAAPGDAWKRLKPRTRAPKFLAALQAVAAWRERTAQTLNIPRGRLLKDDTLTDIAASDPKTLDDLYKLRGMHKGMDAKQLDVLLQELEKARALPKESCPKLPDQPQLPSAADAAIELLRVLLKRQCEKKDVAQKLVASRNDLELVAIGRLSETGLSHGWRWDIFGQYAQALMKGELAMALDPSGAVAILMPESASAENTGA